MRLCVSRTSTGCVWGTQVPLVSSFGQSGAAGVCCWRRAVACACNALHGKVYCAHGTLVLGEADGNMDGSGLVCLVSNSCSVILQDGRVGWGKGWEGGSLEGAMADVRLVSNSCIGKGPGGGGVMALQPCGSRSRCLDGRGSVAAPASLIQT